MESSTKNRRYISTDVLEQYASADEDQARRAIVKNVYERLSADADAELNMLSSFGSDMEKVYDEAALDIDKFIGQLLQQIASA